MKTTLIVIGVLAMIGFILPTGNGGSKTINSNVSACMERGFDYASCKKGHE